ncbi:MinD/ParA family protein [Planctomonas sp. JC2975]|uniref:MinD/ParA family ATP-binding protein n=1 Tax=Planctomonas sp. JC2975 TaxID=2729626 RepID=UPI003211D575
MATKAKPDGDAPADATTVDETDADDVDVDVNDGDGAEIDESDVGDPQPGGVSRLEDSDLVRDEESLEGRDIVVTESGSISVVVDLPPAPREHPPIEESAVAIDDVSIDPAKPLHTQTASVTIVTAHPLQREPLPPRRTPLPTHVEVDVSPGWQPSRRGRRVGEVSAVPESSAMLTADRLLVPGRFGRPAPEGAGRLLLYKATFGVVNLGDSPKVRERKELDRRIQRPLEGGARFVPVLTRKGGVGKTTVSALLGMALADRRDDRIVAIDANPDRGTLSERVAKQTDATVRDVVHRAASITGYTDFSTLVSRDVTRLDVLASDTDPQLSEAFDENDYNVVADLASRFYSIVLTDCGTGIVHSVMRPTLRRADSIVIVSGGSVDEARLASETLTWLEVNGYEELVRNAIIALNTATQGTSLVNVEEIEAHFQSRVRDVVRIPYDPRLAAGAAIDYHRLRPATRHAARVLAALVVEGLPANR